MKNDMQVKKQNAPIKSTFISRQFMKQQILKIVLIAYKKYSLLEIDTITKFLLFDEIYN